MNDVRLMFNIFKNTMLSLLVAVVVGTLLMISVYSIGTESITKQVVKSLPIYEKEDLYYSFTPKVISGQLDNWTDAIILNEAAFKRGDNFNQIVNNALLNPHYGYEDAKPVECLIKAYSTDEAPDVFYYGRYWHGYQIYIKPLLVFYSMSYIRFLSMFFGFFLLILLSIELYKNGGMKLLIPISTGIILLNPISSVLCIQYYSMYYIVLISAYILLKKEIYKSPSYFYFFLWIGILTSFFDFLTYPLVGLCFNLILMLVMTDNTLITRLKQIITAGAFWLVGYFGMWCGKWIIATILTNDNIIRDAFCNVSYRINGDVPWIESYTYFDVLSKNFQRMFHSGTYSLIGIFAVVLLFALFSKKYCFKFDFDKSISLLFIATLPFLWYFVVQNHSIIHTFMAHKNLSVTIVALLYVLISSFHKIPKETK